MTTHQKAEKREGYCPVYDIECPAGLEAAAACELRFESDYNPLTSFRDADIEYCAIYRQEQASQGNLSHQSVPEKNNKLAEDEEQ